MKFVCANGHQITACDVKVSQVGFHHEPSIDLTGGSCPVCHWPLRKVENPSMDRYGRDPEFDTSGLPVTSEHGVSALMQEKMYQEKMADARQQKQCGCTSRNYCDLHYRSVETLADSLLELFEDTKQEKIADATQQKTCGCTSRRICDLHYRP